MRLMAESKRFVEDSQQRLRKQQQQSWLLLVSIFVRKFILEVCGAAGAVWGFSECVGLRTNETAWFWRYLSLLVFGIFFVQWLRRLQQHFQRDQSVCCCGEEAVRVTTSTKDMITHSTRTDATVSTLLSRESSLTSFSKGEEDERMPLVVHSISPVQGKSGRSIAAAESSTASSYQNSSKQRPTLMYSTSSIEMTSDATILSPPSSKPCPTPAATKTTSATFAPNSHSSPNRKIYETSCGSNRRDFRRRHTLEIA